MPDDGRPVGLARASTRAGQSTGDSEPENPADHDRPPSQAQAQALTGHSPEAVNKLNQIVQVRCPRCDPGVFLVLSP